jgi:hypothetical protein
LQTAVAPYVAVRVTDLREVDIGTIRFDFDLTFAAVLMHADGTIYHRYGGRGATGADGYTSLSSLAALLRDTLVEHKAHDRSSRGPVARPAVKAIDLPALQQRVEAGQRIDCVHCHMVHDAEFEAAKADRTWRPEFAFVHPDPARIGIALDRERQATVVDVVAGSPAARAGLSIGDVLLSLGEQHTVRTFSDVQWALQRAPFAATRLPIRFRRGDVVHEQDLALGADWKRSPPEEYAWRPLKWNLSPSTGFGGPMLQRGEKERLQLAADVFAMRVGYIVDWGERAASGRAVRAAGLKQGDVVVAFAGKRDFVGVDHWHAWVALTQKVGAEVEVVVLREGVETVLRYRLPE